LSSNGGSDDYDNDMGLDNDNKKEEALIASIGMNSEKAT
jgi:hypothetical protein